MNKGIVNAGDAGIFTYAAGKKALLRKVNMEDAGLGTVIEVEPGTEASLDIFSGYAKGILISDSSRLWEYDVKNNQMEVMLDWDDEGVKLKHYEISLVSLLGGGRVYVMAKSPSGKGIKLVYIEEREGSEIPVKQTVVLGTYEIYDPEGNELSGLEQMTDEFNKYQQEYEIEIKRYENAPDLYMELLKGEGPDCFQLIGKSVLASKGVLEDLSPYFERSLKVKETDLLPSVRSAGYEEGGLRYLFTRFSLRGFMVEKGVTQNGAWTPEEYLQLGEQYPEALLTPQISPQMVLQYAVSADMDSFLDWKDRECWFDGERFISILESIKRVTDNKQMADIMEWRLNACQWLYDRKTLTEYFEIDTFREYIEYRDAYEEFAEFAGYPNSDKKPYYSFIPDYVFAMNSASRIKEGVWAFLEYLLSEEYQSSVTSFPVREDIFHKSIARQAADWNRRAEHDPGRDMNHVSLLRWDEYPEVTGEDEDYIKYLAENAYWDTSLNDVLSILYEETGAFWTGDKSAEEAASIIQNRVSLYLDEL